MGNLDGLRRELSRKAQSAAVRTANDWQNRLRRESPADSRNMRSRTIVTTRADARGARIEATVDTPYAHIVRSGQRPHTITPRRPGGVLAFVSGGQTVFARSVNHPGAQGNTWWDDALRDLPDLLQRNWDAS